MPTQLKPAQRRRVRDDGDCNESSRFSSPSVATLAAWGISLAPALLLIWFASTAGWLSGSSGAVDREDDGSEVTGDELVSAAVSATEFLNRQVVADGRFTYRVNLDPTVKVVERYNLLRHAGTIYAMGMAHERIPDHALADTIHQACDFLRGQIGPVPGAPGALAVWSHPEVTRRGDHAEAKLGASGLGLLALLHEETISPGSNDPETLEGLGRFIAYMQKEDGSFYSKYLPEEDGFDDWVSIYYPSEAAFGLILLHEQTGQPEWLQRAVNALSYLARTRVHEDISDLPHDHWSLLATERLMHLPEIRDDKELCQLLNGHAVQMAEAFLASQEKSTNTLRHGSFSLGGRSAGSATRLEGLLAALEFLPASEVDLRERIESACRDGVAFLLRAQVKEGEAAGGFPRSIYGNPEHEARRPVQGRDSRSSEIRIDYVQHALSALLQYEDHMRASTLAGGIQ